MKFTYDINNDIGKVRLEIGDTVHLSGVLPDGANIDDLEIQVYLDREGSVMGAVAGLCEMLATRYARLCDITLGPERQSYSQISRRYESRAEKLRLTYGGVGEGAISVPPLRVDGYSYDVASDEVEESGEYASL